MIIWLDTPTYTYIYTHMYMYTYEVRIYRWWYTQSYTKLYAYLNLIWQMQIVVNNAVI